MNIHKLKQKKTIQELLEFGIINFDKPADWTSFDVVAFVRGKLKLRKVSHFGTLDPMVTGVLPLALNRACKLTGFFIGEDKEYRGTMRMHEEISLEKINKIIQKKFVGRIMQLPPVKSRVKRQLREREIMKFKLFEKNGKDISFLVECQGGTYIRKLVHDLGEELGIGAHMVGLRRIRAGIFKEQKSILKEDFEKAVNDLEKGDETSLREMIIPAEIISEIYPVIKIKKDNLKSIFTGKPIHRDDLIKKSKIKKESITCVFAEDKFIGMYKLIDGKDIFAKAEFVMQPIKH